MFRQHIELHGEICPALLVNCARCLSFAAFDKRIAHVGYFVF